MGFSPATPSRLATRADSLKKDSQRRIKQIAPLFHLKKKKGKAKEWSESPVRAKKKGSRRVKVKRAMVRIGREGHSGREAVTSDDKS